MPSPTLTTSDMRSKRRPRRCSAISSIHCSTGRAFIPAFLTCYIVSLGTTAETVEKLTLRILGCLVGAAAGYGTMIFLIPYLTSITALMVVVFAGALAAGYVSAGSERISYAGFQIAFAFFLCVIQGPSPAFDLSTARDRVIGILIGNVVAYLVSPISGQSASASASIRQLPHSCAGSPP